MSARLDAAIESLDGALRHSVAMRAWLRNRRWCGAALGRDVDLAVKDRAVLGTSGEEAVVFFLIVAQESSHSIPVHVPLAIGPTRREPEAYELRTGDDVRFVAEGERSEIYARFVAEGLRDRLVIRTQHGGELRFQGEPIGTFRSADTPVEDSSNLLVRIRTDRGEAIFKSYKLLDVRNREPDILGRLNKRKFPHTPRYHGELALGRGTDRVVLGLATERIAAPDAFAWLTQTWREGPVGAPSPGFEVGSRSFAAALGHATAMLHEALLDGHPGPFQAEVFTKEDAQVAIRAALANLSDSMGSLASLAKGEDAQLAAFAREARTLVFENRDRIESALAGLEATVGTAKGVTHADLHLGQVLRTESGALFFVDFEGEPERAPGDRSAKLPPLRDVATMNRSFSYVKHYVWREAIGGDATAAWRLLQPRDQSPAEGALAGRLGEWEESMIATFDGRYLDEARVPTGVEDAERAVRGWAVEKALYEFRYELKHRPQNVFIPLEGLISLSTPR